MPEFIACDILGHISMGESMSFEIKNIKKSYGKKTPLEDISFVAEESRCVGILGKNGSGKSTLLSILAGVQKCDAGEFLGNGENLFKNRKKLANDVGYVPQGTPLIEELSARDNLLLWYGKDQLDKELQNGVLKLLGIGDFLKVPVQKMSGGMKKRLSIGCAMAKKPPILLLDEPTAALDLTCKEQIADYLRSYKAAGGLLLLTTHDVLELQLCDAWYILKDGVLHPFTFDGDLHKLIESL